MSLMTMSKTVFASTECSAVMQGLFKSSLCGNKSKGVFAYSEL
jgi:hypothetical protein